MAKKGRNLLKFMDKWAYWSCYRHLLFSGYLIDRDILLFIAGPTIIKGFVCGDFERWLSISGRRPDFFLPDFKMFKYPPDNIGLGFADKADDLHLGMAVRTFQRIHLPHFLNVPRSKCPRGAVPPRLGRQPAWFI